MCKSIIIQQKGIAETLTVDALRLKKQDGGTEDWLPADGKNLVELQIGGSGTYRASDYGAYGISVARVYPKVGGGATSKAAQQPEFGNLHTPSIQEGGQPVMLSARLVKTNLQGGGTCLWVPEDEVSLESKYVDHNGAYTARADGCYGYSQITVSGVDVEIKKDDDGDDVAEITDGGETREEKLPSEIRIEREPYFVGPYGDRAYISFDGLLVKAYTESGKLWTDAKHPDGTIPMSELVLPVTVTDIDATVERYATSDLVEGPVPFASTAIATWMNGEEEQEFTWDAPSGGAIVTGWNPNLDSNKIALIKGAKEAFQDPDYQFTHDGKTAHYANIGITHFTRFDSVSPHPAVNSSSSAIPPRYIWTALYGDVHSGGQPVPVQFARPYDGRVLEDEFKVQVIDIKPGGHGED